MMTHSIRSAFVATFSAFLVGIVCLGFLTMTGEVHALNLEERMLIRKALQSVQENSEVKQEAMEQALAMKTFAPVTQTPTTKSPTPAPVATRPPGTQAPRTRSPTHVCYTSMKIIRCPPALDYQNRTLCGLGCLFSECPGVLPDGKHYIQCYCGPRLMSCNNIHF